MCNSFSNLSLFCPCRCCATQMSLHYSSKLNGVFNLFPTTKFTRSHFLRLNPLFKNDVILVQLLETSDKVLPTCWNDGGREDALHTRVILLCNYYPATSHYLKLVPRTQERLFDSNCKKLLHSCF